MTLEEYMRELLLMSRQYGQEEELYPLINMLLRENDNVRHLSVRDVHNKGSKGARKKLFRGYASYPDLAIVSESLNIDLNKEILEEGELKKIYGCVEAKSFDQNSEKTTKQEDDEKRNCIFKILGDKNANEKWTLDYLYILSFKKKEGNWSDGYYTTLTEENVNYGEEKDINDAIKELKFFSVRNGKKAKFDDFKNYEKYKISKRTVSINERTHEDIVQLLCELFLYGKVLYTDGLVWYYLELMETSKNNICNAKALSVLLEKDDNEDTRKNLFIDAIENKNKIEVLSIEIGNLKDIYDGLKEEIEKEKVPGISLSIVGQFLERNVKYRLKWNRLKYNLASIDWCGTNTAEQFL